MDLYESIVFYLRRSKTPCAAAVGSLDQKTATHQDSVESSAKLKSPTIDDILADLQHNVEQTSEVFKQIDGYIPALRVSGKRELLQTPKIESRASAASPISYPEEEPLSNSVVRIPPATAGAAHYDCAFDGGVDAAKGSEPADDLFSQQLSHAMYQVRKSSSRLTSYIYQKERPKTQTPQAKDKLAKAFAYSTIYPPKLTVERRLDAVARFDNQVRYHGTTITDPLAQNTPWYENVRRRLDSLQRSCVITPFIPATNLEYTEFQTQAFGDREISITMQTVVQASRILLHSSDSLFYDLKKLTVERLKSVNAGYKIVVKYPRLTRLMWKFCSEHGLTFRVQQLDVVRLFAQMKQILAANFSKYGGRLADFLSCQLELDYDVVGICVLVLFSQD